jgi:hypothetical protein
MDATTPPPFPYLTTAEYDAVVRAALRRLGLADDQAGALMAARWPLDCGGVLAECSGRGLRLELLDLVEFLGRRFDRPVDPDEIGWPPRLVDELLGWASALGRGRPTPTAGPPPRPDPVSVLSVADMLAGLRSEEIGERAAAGFRLAVSLGAGLRLSGEEPTDVEYLIGPQLSGLIGRAIAGDDEAASELETVVTADAEHAYRPDDGATEEIPPWTN